MKEPPPTAGFLPCSRGWDFFGNSCYFFSDVAASWENSQIFCRALGAELLQVDDAAEKLHVQAQLRGPSWIRELDPKSSLEKCGAVGPDGLRAEFPCGTPLSWVCEEPL
ncbi:CD209 antigen-like protein D [Lonchura striata]|uniref:CD209 antigen-like protein D n=1 Tax=Lonchura striata TaxID=40157 RepID=UPI000B4DA8BD|nr:CD209 antigen-like protein D [Lonchura striata domestica]